MLSVSRGAALYVGALIGPGLLLVPSLATRAAGPAAIVAWGALLVLSAPLAIAFAALGVQQPVAGGVAAYVRAAFGAVPATITGAWFLAAVVIGGPAVALIGGYYVADLTGSGTGVAVVTALAMQVAVLGANATGLKLSSGFQLALSAILVAVVGTAVAVALPSRATQHWTPFAPHGWWAAGTAANILMWLFIGWEAMAQMAGEFRRPARDLPRAIGLAFAVIAVLYTGLAVATITVTAGGGSRIPLADLIGVGFGRAGRDATAILAVALTMGTMNVYTAGAAKLAAAIAPSSWLGGDGHRDIPRRPLIVLAATGVGLLLALAAGAIDADDMVRATSACFIAVYVLALASAGRLLSGRARLAALVALPLVCVVAVFSAGYLLVPALVAVAATWVARRGPGRRGTGHRDAPDLPASSGHPRPERRRSAMLHQLPAEPVVETRR